MPSARLTTEGIFIFEQTPIPVEERCLTEVDHLNDLRLPDGSHDPAVLAEVYKNLLGGTKEAAMPYSVSRTFHEFVEMGPLTEAGEGLRAYMWLGRTAVENAESGYRYHRHAEAIPRVDVEVEEAMDAEETLRPGIIKVFISPRASEKDATYDIAKEEHLADEDSLRISYCETDVDGNITGRIVESVLVRGIPLDSWVMMLKDSHNLFGKSIVVRDEESALAVMEVFKELETTPDKLPEGVISLIVAVIPYITDLQARAEVERQLELFRGSQEAMQAEAESITDRWMQFEIELADSLYSGWATKAVEGFISSFQNLWTEEDLAVILGHQMPGNEYLMSRELAAILETAKQNMLWTRAAVATGNEEVIVQLDQELAERIYVEEMYLQATAQNPYLQRQLGMGAETDRLIAGSNVEVGGGCMGDNGARFNGTNPDGTPSDPADKPSGSERKDWKKKKDVCVVKNCPTRPGKVEVGPCGVCLGRCQPIYDKGDDPSRGVVARRVIGESAVDKIVSQLQHTKQEQSEFKRPQLSFA